MLATPIVRRRVRGWVSGLLLWVWVLAAGRVEAQPGAGTGLQPGEVLVALTLKITGSSTVQLNDGSGYRSTLKGEMSVRGMLAARLDAPAVGRRTLVNFRAIPGALTGTLNDEQVQEAQRTFGEGGWQNAPFRSEVTWRAREVPVKVPFFFLDIDLDGRTWSIPDFADEATQWLSELDVASSYWASSRGGSGTSFFWNVSADRDQPPPGLRGGPPWISTTHVFDLAFVDAPDTLLRLRDPQPLVIGEGGVLAGGKSGRITRPEGWVEEWEMGWAIQAPTDQLELRVASPGWVDWRPKAGLDTGNGERTPGPPLAFSARVQKEDGSPVTGVRIRKLEWTLNGTSRLPGRALNYPYGSQDTSPDLELRHPKAEGERQSVVLEDVPGLQSKIEILPYDWGGWSTLKVTAELDDGRRLEGKLLSPEGEVTEILVPYRTDGSKIARSWLRTYGLDGAPDVLDDDALPPGKTSIPGDGFSLFEEYRGFYVNGPLGGGGAGWSLPKHLSANPVLREVFVYDRAGTPDSRAGSGLFARASGLSAWLLRPGTRLLDDSRLVNRNRGDGPTRGNQHAIGIRSETSNFWRPYGGRGRPQRSDLTLSSADRFGTFAPRLRGRGDLYRRAIAQELMRSCGVGLPGAGDEWLTVTVTRGPDGGPRVVTDRGETVVLRDETGHDVGEDWLREVDAETAATRRRLMGLPAAAADAAARAAAEVLSSRRLLVGAQGGQHSGPLGNLMRYTFADAYRIQGTSSIIVLPAGFQETVGLKLTETSQGDGYNAGGKRYGDSPRPPSAHELVVNDRVP